MSIGREEFRQRRQPPTQPPAGRGAEIAPRASTLGILGMRERASRFGGECTVKRRDPRGTIVSVVVPQRYAAIAAP